MKILALSGSLRAGSSNTTALQAIALLASGEVEIVLYENLAELPPFNPDREDTGLAPIQDFQTQLQQADGVLISSPEYAHGVPGALKNALDWVVGSGELIHKPVALINATPPATFAQASLTETLTVMMARLIPEASVTVPLRGQQRTAAQIAADPELGALLQSGLTHFLRAIERAKKGGDP